MKDLINDAFEYLFPLHRSLAGEENRKSLRYLQSIADFDVMEIPSGTKAYDWTVPQEWEVNEAYIETDYGYRVVDYKDNNLHLVSYSNPVKGMFSWEELSEHIHTLGDYSFNGWSIPYRTAYYTYDWGFCMDRNLYNILEYSSPSIKYNVVIDAEFIDGSMSIGERIVQGESEEEYLFSTYCCHPSMANDNLSGMILWALLLKELENRNLRHTYRFVIAPETIGHIAYIWLREQEIRNIDGGYVLSTVAGPGPLSYRESFQGNSKIDRAARLALRRRGIQYPFDINGSDERQYSSPAFRIPVGAVCKSKYYEYEEYHTSLDNLDFVSAENLLQTMNVYLDIIDILENDKTYYSLNAACEPMLGKRDLYPEIGGAILPGKTDLDAIKWVMFYSDASHSIMDISELSGVSVKRLSKAAGTLVENDLLREIKV
jgi:aminopeptidase-like protein